MKTPPLNQPLSLSSFDEPLLCIVHIASQHPATLHQVVLRQDKVSAQGFIRLGETIGDEANCWIRPEHLQVLDVLGTVDVTAGQVPTVTPIPRLEAVA